MNTGSSILIDCHCEEACHPEEACPERMRQDQDLIGANELMSADLSIVVPCYNEAGNIPLIIAEFSKLLDANPGLEVILVDNGSTDNSAEVFKQELPNCHPEERSDVRISSRNLGDPDVLQAQDDSRMTVVRVEENQGYGHGILFGLEHANGKVLAWTHADMQTDPADVLTAYKQYKATNDEMCFVKGARKERKLLEAFFSWGMQVLASIVLKTPLEEINAQPKLFSRKFYDLYMKEGAPKDFSLDLYALYHAYRNCKLITIPVYFNKRIHGEAKGGCSWSGRIKLIQRTLAYIFELADSLA